MYDFKTEPYAHQREIFEKSWGATNYALFLEMGTGKSKLAIDTVLIIAPKGVYANWTQKEIPLHLPCRI